MNTYIGLDTSCYTTSLALVDSDRSLVLDRRTLLKVNKGSKGLRQSEGVFQHVRNLGIFAEELRGVKEEFNVAAVAASVKPRPLPESYMPVFTVGENFAKAAAGIAGIPFFATTHQESHLMAGLWSAGGPQSGRFLTVHLSGGTTELIETLRTGTDFQVRIIGGTGDISAGQFVDRVGVAMGIDFPCGQRLEEMAGKALITGSALELSCSAKDCIVSFSGPETHAKRLLDAGEDRHQVALAVLKCIARGLEKIISEACSRSNITEVLMVGGVSANKLICEYLRENLNCKLYFPQPHYCGDNAVGTALIAFEKLIEKKNI
jgi:N6-L-threonylcarbamoyladenine synthase